MVALRFSGDLASIAKKPYIFVIFQGGGGPNPLSPSGSAHAIALFVCADAYHTSQQVFSQVRNFPVFNILIKIKPEENWS